MAYKDFFWGFLDRDYAHDHKIIEGESESDVTTHDGMAKQLGYGHESEEAELDGYVRFLMPREGGTLIMSGFWDTHVLANMAEFVRHDHRIVGPVEVELSHLRDASKDKHLKYPDPKRAALVLSMLARKAPEAL